METICPQKMVPHIHVLGTGSPLICLWPLPRASRKQLTQICVTLAGSLLLESEELTKWPHDLGHQNTRRISRSEAVSGDVHQAPCKYCAGPSDSNISKWCIKRRIGHGQLDTFLLGTPCWRLSSPSKPTQQFLKPADTRGELLKCTLYLGLLF